MRTAGIRAAGVGTAGATGGRTAAFAGAVVEIVGAGTAGVLMGGIAVVVVVRAVAVVVVAAVFIRAAWVGGGGNGEKRKDQKEREKKTLHGKHLSLR